MIILAKLIFNFFTFTVNMTVGHRGKKAIKRKLKKKHAYDFRLLPNNIYFREPFKYANYIFT